MNKLLIVLALILLLTSIGCDDNKKIVNGNNTSNENFNYIINETVGGDDWEWGRDIITVPTGGYIVAGWTDSYGIGRNDLYLIRVDGQGNVLWDKNFGGTGNNSDDHGEGVTLTPDGNILAVGGSNAFGSEYEKYIVKVDMNGNLIWEKTIGASTYESISKVFTVSDGYIIGGNSGGFAAQDYFVMKIDLDGNLVWDSTYGTPYSDFRCMTPTDDGGFILAGTYVLKINVDGESQWTNDTFGRTEPQINEVIHSVIETSDGGVVIAGEQIAPLPQSSYSYDLYVAKLNSSGTLLWQYSYQNDDNMSGGYIVENTDGTLSACTVDRETGELYIAKLNASGNLVSYNNSGIIGYPYDMIIGHTGYAITGSGDYNVDPNGEVLILELQERIR